MTNLRKYSMNQAGFYFSLVIEGATEKWYYFVSRSVRFKKLLRTITKSTTYPIAYCNRLLAEPTFISL